MVSVLFNEPKLLKSITTTARVTKSDCFSALQRAEIAEMLEDFWSKVVGWCFSALQRAEIAEMLLLYHIPRLLSSVSVLFNEPKLLKLMCAKIIINK